MPLFSYVDDLKALRNPIKILVCKKRIESSTCENDFSHRWFALMIKLSSFFYRNLLETLVLNRGFLKTNYQFEILITFWQTKFISVGISLEFDECLWEQRATNNNNNDAIIRNVRWTIGFELASLLIIRSLILTRLL